MSQHAVFAPSGFKALILCPAKPAMEHGRPDVAGKDADHGTSAHFLAAWCQTRGEQAPLYLGRKIVVWQHPQTGDDGAIWGGDPLPEGAEVRRQFPVDDEMAEAVQSYIDTVRDLAGPDGTMFVEQAVPIGHITGEDGAQGTSDAIVLRGDEIIVIDLKYGKGVEVSALDNSQLKLYALGALAKFDLVGDITRVRMVIVQPRAGGVSEDTCTADELQAWGREVATPAANEAAAVLLDVGKPGWLEAHADKLRPNEDACRFCKGKGACPALDGTVKRALSAEFTDLTTESEPEREAIAKASIATVKASDQLGAKLAAVPLIEIWIKGVRAEVERELLAGRQVEGFKLIAGKRGARAWADEAAAEQLLRKTFRLKVEDAYDLTLISPTKAEKKLKDTPKRWAKAQALITQSDGKSSVAPVSDPRAALEIKPIESEFTPITSEAPATADDLV